MRKVNRRRYVLAFVITAAIFFLGFFFGFIMDLQRINYFQTVNDANQMNIRSLQIQDDLVNSGTARNQCAAFRFMFDKAITELENNRERLELYSQQSNVKQADFDTIKREYMLSQINFWQISQNLKESCPNASDFVTIIYFFSDAKKCPDCDKQATVLNYYKSQLKENILIFSIDEQMDSTEPLVKLLKNIYDVNNYPTLVVENITYENYTDQHELGNILCNLYSSNASKSLTCGG